MVKEKDSVEGVAESGEVSAGRPVAPIHPPGLLIRRMAFGGAHKLKRPRRRWLILAVIILLVMAASAGYETVYRLPRQRALTFMSQSRSIVVSLQTEIDNIYQNNFLQTKNTTQDLNKASTALEVRQSDLAKSQAKIAKLKSDYKALQPTNQNSNLKRDTDNLFKQADSITTKYRATLTLRQQTIEAYTDTLSELTKYSQAAPGGGDTDVFAAQTAKIASLAMAASKKLSGLSVQPDDMALNDLRLAYLNDVVTTFTKVSGYYQDYQPDQINAHLKAFSQRSIQRNSDVSRKVNDYLTSSSLARDFTVFKRNADTLKTQLSLPPAAAVKSGVNNSSF